MGWFRADDPVGQARPRLYAASCTGTSVQVGIATSGTHSCARRNSKFAMISKRSSAERSIAHGILHAFQNAVGEGAQCVAGGMAKQPTTEEGDARAGHCCHRRRIAYGSFISSTTISTRFCITSAMRRRFASYPDNSRAWQRSCRASAPARYASKSVASTRRMGAVDNSSTVPF